MDKGTLDTAAWVVFEGVLREDQMRVGGKDHKGKSKLYPLKYVHHRHACLPRIKTKNTSQVHWEGSGFFCFFFSPAVFLPVKSSLCNASLATNEHCCCHVLPSCGNWRTQSHFTTWHSANETTLRCALLPPSRQRIGRGEEGCWWCRRCRALRGARGCRLQD